MVRLVIITLLVCFSHKLLGQNNKINAGRFEISIGGGALIPVGKFASTSTEGFEQTFFHVNGPPDQYLVRFFSKENHSHAKRGRNLNFEINYLTKKSWVHGVDLGTTFNTINSLMANEYFTDAQFPMEITLHRPYKTNYIGYILGYQFSTKNIDFRPYQKVGYSRLDFPFYNLQNTQFGDSFIHEGDRPKSNSIYFETGLVANIIIFKNTTLGLNISYRYADYDYSMIKRRVPGGSSRILVTDQVNLRAIMTGFRLAYKL